MRTRLLIILLNLFVPTVFAAADLLSLAAEGFKHEELRQALRGLPAPIDGIRDGDEKTALHLSAQRGQFEDAFLLLQAGAGANAIDATGRTPLFYSLEQHGESALLLVELLTYNGADVNLIAADGNTPLAITVRNRHLAAIEFLLRRGAVLELAGGDAPRHDRAEHSRRGADGFAGPGKIASALEKTGRASARRCYPAPLHGGRASSGSQLRHRSASGWRRGE